MRCVKVCDALYRNMKCMKCKQVKLIYTHAKTAAELAADKQVLTEQHLSNSCPLLLSDDEDVNVFKLG